MMRRKIILKLKWFYFDTLSLFGVRPKLNKRKGEVQFLCFHGICDDYQEYINGRFYKNTCFKELISQLKKETNIISLQDFFDQNLAKEKLNVVITFDDGYKKTTNYLIPIIEQEEIPVTFFVTNVGGLPLWQDLLDVLFFKNHSFEQLENAFPESKGKSNKELKKWIFSQSPEKIFHITQLLNKMLGDSNGDLKGFYELMSNEDLIKCKNNNLISLANHSANHFNFTTLTEKEITDQYSSCKSLLETIGSDFSNVFAYPFGAFDERTIDQLKKNGVKAQFTTDDISRKVDGVIGRLVINPFISVQNQLRAISNGRY